MIRKTTIVSAVLLLSTGVLAGCGSDDTKKSSGDTKADSSSGSSYCDLLKASKDDISAFTSDTAGAPDFSKFDDIVDRLGKIADKAPDQVADDWKTLTDALASLTEALDDAGTNIQDFMTAATTGKLPEGVSKEDLQALVQKLSAVQSSDIQEAGAAITKDAKDECGVDLG
jgi:phage-related tail protein